MNLGPGSSDKERKWLGSFKGPVAFCVAFKLRYLTFCLYILQADGFDAVERVAVSGSHRGLLRDKKVFQLIQNWLGVGDKASNHKKTSKVMDAGSR